MQSRVVARRFLCSSPIRYRGAYDPGSQAARVGDRSDRCLPGKQRGERVSCRSIRWATTIRSTSTPMWGMIRSTSPTRRANINAETVHGERMEEVRRRSASASEQNGAKREQTIRTSRREGETEAISGVRADCVQRPQTLRLRAVEAPRHRFQRSDRQPAHTKREYAKLGRPGGKSGLYASDGIASVTYYAREGLKNRYAMDARVPLSAGWIIESHDAASHHWSKRSARIATELAYKGDIPRATPRR